MNLLLLLTITIISAMFVYCGPPVFIEELLEVLSKERRENKTIEGICSKLEELAKDRKQTRQKKKVEIEQEILPMLSKDLSDEFRKVKNEAINHLKKLRAELSKKIARGDSAVELSIDRYFSMIYDPRFSEQDAESIRNKTVQELSHSEMELYHQVLDMIEGKKKTVTGISMHTALFAIIAYFTLVH